MEPASASRSPAIADGRVEALIHELPAFGAKDAVCLTGVNWDQYRRVREAEEALGRRLQISYASGRIELLPNLFRGETRRSMLRWFVWLLAEQFELEMDALGSTTLADQIADYGFDPHESFCIHGPGRIATTCSF